MKTRVPISGVWIFQLEQNITKKVLERNLSSRKFVTDGSDASFPDDSLCVKVCFEYSFHDGLPVNLSCTTARISKSCAKVSSTISCPFQQSTKLP